MEPFIGMIIMFGGSFAPRGWAFCDGQLLSIAENQALFSILGTTYGGDGRTTFGLPDLRGRIPMHPGSGPGLSPHRLGEKSGMEQVGLNLNQIPPHNHSVTLKASEEDATDTEPQGRIMAISDEPIYNSNNPDVDLHAGSAVSGNAGGGQPHYNMQPYQCVNFIIALQGIYPSRS